MCLESRMSKCFLHALGHIVFDSPAAGDGLRREKEKKCKVSEWRAERWGEGIAGPPSTLNCQLHDSHVGVGPSVAKH
jgi:hypothetical protein